MKRWLMIILPPLIALAIYAALVTWGVVGPVQPPVTGGR